MNYDNFKKTCIKKLNSKQEKSPTEFRDEVELKRTNNDSIH